MKWWKEHPDTVDMGITPDLEVWEELMIEEGGSMSSWLDSGNYVEDLIGWRVG